MKYSEKKLDEVKVFKDPVHRYVQVIDQVIWDLIATPEFQRLRRIKQLGTTYLTFHGAEHTRFNHSLGVYEIVRRIINKFEHRSEWNNDEKLLCLCAALLHDLGHGPFSHSFEKVFNLDHEKFTQLIILGETDVNKVLAKVDVDFPKKVADVIAKEYEDQLVVSIISSQIDADRMDYLLRDAYYTGVSYGKFDMERILRVMRPSENQVVIKSTGMHAVEDYIMSRYQMYWQVYFHPVSRSAEVILTKIFDRVKYLYEKGYTFKFKPDLLIPFFENQVTIQDYLKLDEAVIYFYFQRWCDEDDFILQDLSKRFINRRLFKYVEFNPDQERTKYERLQQLFEQLGIDTRYYLVVDSSSDLPYDVYRAGEGRKPIYLKMPTNELKELSNHSDIVDSITGKTRKDYKLYFPIEMINNIDDQSIKEEIQYLLSKHKQANKT